MEAPRFPFEQQHILPIPSGHQAGMLLAQWSIRSQSAEAPLQPWAFLKRPDLNAAQPRRSLCVVITRIPSRPLKK